MPGLPGRRGDRCEVGRVEELPAKRSAAAAEERSRPGDWVLAGEGVRPRAERKELDDWAAKCTLRCAFCVFRAWEAIALVVIAPTGVMESVSASCLARERATLAAPGAADIWDRMKARLSTSEELRSRMICCASPR